MKLRDHPKLKGKWPPKWHKVHLTSRYKTGPMGEQGDLKDVKGPFIHGPSGHLALVVEYEGEEWTGKIGLNDTVLLRELFSKLASASTMRMPLEEVGNIEVD